MAVQWGAVGAGIAAVGTVLGYMGGKKQDARFAEMASQQYHMDKLNYEFSWQEARDAYAYQMEDIDIAEWNLAQTRKFQEQQALNEWIDKDKQRMFDYNNQVDAYNASVGAYETQLEFNEVADQLGLNSARMAYQDDLIRMAYQLEDLDRTRSKAEVSTALKRLELVSQRTGAISSTKIERDKLRAGLAATKSKYQTDLEKQQLLGLAAEGKIKAIGQSGRTARKNIAAALANSQRLEFAIADAMTRSRVTTGLNIQAINDKLQTLGGQLDLADSQLVEELYNTRVEVEAGERQLNDQLRSTNIALEADLQKRKLDKYGADLRAREMIAPTPILAPELSRPIEQPEPVLQRPRYPRKGPEPIKYAASAGHGLAALGSGMASLSGAVAGLQD